MTDEDDTNYTIVQYMSDNSGYRCGYCKSKNTNFSHGMWAHKMNVNTYLYLIDRGWRRSGKYCYKPMMDKTCCPQYTIRCDSDNFILSKSQKKVLKRMHAFLSSGIKKNDKSEAESCISLEFCESDQIQSKYLPPKDMANIVVNSSNISPKQTHKGSLPALFNVPQSTLSQATEEITDDAQPHPSRANNKESNFKPGLGPDPSKPLCKKSKSQRLERRATKGCSNSEMKNCTQISKNNQAKSLEDYITDKLPDFPAHRLELRLVPVGFLVPEFANTFGASSELFKNYQMIVHQDPSDECDESSYKNFLIDGPLRPRLSSNGPPKGYGPFHQQYWLDGRLIAVGVLDILPHAVSSVYFFYDPEYSFLSLGTYSSLREIALTRELSRRSSSPWRYYMGFYIHSCPKMRYKGQYKPSSLLCPETYKWVPIEKCLPKLDITKYSKLSEYPKLMEDIDINKVRCLYNGRIQLYGDLRQGKHCNEEDNDEVREYLTLVGSQAANTIFLFRE